MECTFHVFWLLYMCLRIVETATPTGSEVSVDKNSSRRLGRNQSPSRSGTQIKEKEKYGIKNGEFYFRNRLISLQYPHSLQFLIFK